MSNKSKTKAQIEVERDDAVKQLKSATAEITALKEQLKNHKDGPPTPDPLPLVVAISAPKGKQIQQLEKLIDELPAGGNKDYLTDLKNLWSLAREKSEGTTMIDYDRFYNAFLVGRIDTAVTAAALYQPVSVNTFESINTRLIKGKSCDPAIGPLLAKADSFFKHSTQSNAWELDLTAVTNMFDYAEELKNPSHPKHDRHAKISSLADWLTRNYYNAGADAGYTERRLMVERVLLAYKTFNGDAPSARAFIIVYAKELFDWYPAMIEFVIAYVFGRHMRNASAGQVHQLVKEVFEEFVNPSYGIGEGVDFNTTRAGGGKREREENRDRPRYSYAHRGDNTPRRGPRWENTSTPTNTLHNGRTRLELAYLFTHKICTRCLSKDEHNFQECTKPRAESVALAWPDFVKKKPQ